MQQCRVRQWDFVCLSSIICLFWRSSPSVIIRNVDLAQHSYECINLARLVGIEILQNIDEFSCELPRCDANVWHTDHSN